METKKSMNTEWIGSLLKAAKEGDVRPSQQVAREKRRHALHSLETEVVGQAPWPWKAWALSAPLPGRQRGDVGRQRLQVLHEQPEYHVLLAVADRLGSLVNRALPDAMSKVNENKRPPDKWLR